MHAQTYSALKTPICITQFELLIFQGGVVRWIKSEVTVEQESKQEDQCTLSAGGQQGDSKGDEQGGLASQRSCRGINLALEE